MIWRAAWAWPALAVMGMSQAGVALPQGTANADASAAARVAIEACIRQLDEATTGLPALETRCPQLAASLAAAQIRPLIIPSSRDLLDRNSLTHLERLLHSRQGPSPSVATLAPILQALPGTTVAPRSWWQRLWSWVLEQLNHHQSASGNPWLTELARQLASARWLWQAIIWGTLIALPVGVV